MDMAAENGEWIMCKYVVIDLEMCKVPKAMRTSKYQWSSETIQIGAVLVDVIDLDKDRECPNCGASMK